MNKKQKKLISLFSSFIVIVFGILFFSSCESSRVGPYVPPPNPPAPPPQPIVLTGFVRDISNLSGIPGATVKILKADNSIVTTLLTDNSGKFSYDVTNITDNTLSVMGTKDGYGQSTKIAEINKALNIAAVSDIILTKLVVVSAPVTPAAGGQASTTNTQSVSTTPVSVTVPPNAVPQNITLTVAAVPAAQLPKPPTANTSVQSAVQLGPSGVTFLQPVTVVFPLPNKKAAGSTLSVIRLNPTTNIWENRNIIATVDASGTAASAKLTSFSANAVQDNLSITVATGTTLTIKIADVELTSGSVEKTYNYSNSITISTTGTVDSGWLLGEVKSKANIDVGNFNQLLMFNFPPLLDEYKKDGKQYNPSFPNQSGYWKFVWTVNKATTTQNWTASGGVAPNAYTGSGTITKETVSASAGAWVWVKTHDQGG